MVVAHVSFSRPSSWGLVRGLLFLCTKSDPSAAESTPPGAYSTRVTALHLSIRSTA